MLEHELDLPDPGSGDRRGECLGLEKRPVVPELDGRIVECQIVPLGVGGGTLVIKVKFGIVPGTRGVTLELTGPRVGKLERPVFVFVVRHVIDQENGVPGDRIQDGIRTDNLIDR